VTLPTLIEGIELPTRLVGLVVAAIVGIIALLLPLADWWVIDNGFVPIPGGLASTLGLAIAGFVVAPRVQSHGHRLGLVAVRFALISFLAAIPLLAVDALLLTVRPLDEPWPVTFGPVLGTIFGTVVYAPDVLLVAFLAAGAWTALTVYALKFLAIRPQVTFGKPD
jgi:hypothetical protein